MSPLSLKVKFVRTASLVVGVSLLFFSIGSGPIAPFVFWPDAARSLIDHTIRGHLLSPSILWLAVLLLSAAAFWMVAMGWLWAWMLRAGHPVDEHGHKFDRRIWRPRWSWWFFGLVLGAAAVLPLLFNPNSPGPGARETGRYEETAGEAAPVLEPYRWGKPFLLRAERENIQKSIAILTLWFPVGLVAWRMGERLDRIVIGRTPARPPL